MPLESQFKPSFFCNSKAHFFLCAGGNGRQINPVAHLVYQGGGSADVIEFVQSFCLQQQNIGQANEDNVLCPTRITVLVDERVMRGRPMCICPYTCDVCKLDV